MVKTPPHLVRKFGLRREVSTRRVTRAYLSFLDKKKRKELLSVMWTGEMSGALEEYGAPAARVERKSQRIMAAMNGVDVSTWNRRMNQFLAPDGRWDEERRRKFSELKRAQAAARKKIAGAKPRDTGRSSHAGDDGGTQSTGDLVPPSRKQMRSVNRLFILLSRNAQFGQVQLYSMARAPELKPWIEKKKNTDKPSDAEVMAAAFGTDLFDPNRDDLSGYKRIPSWVYDPRILHTDKCECQSGQMGLQLSHSVSCSKCGGSGIITRPDPLPDYGRVLLTYLLLLGISEGKQYVMRTQEQIGEAIGCDANTVAKYEDMWEALMVIKCTPGAVHRDCLKCGKTFIDRCATCGATDGPVNKREPHKIHWIADRLLDQEIAQIESQRFQALRETLKDKVAADRAALIHAGLLKEWVGKEHTIEAFWKEMRRRLAAENVNKNAISVLFPFFRE